LLAEAFWLMEGYFVRTLGMHRVYNSAFMNMLKMEENAKYRSVMKNVLEFNPEILRRFVNFMTNPDEATAIAQFGKGDKYIGVALMMVTMPGLPLFGHGQIEGFTEKYGMEYRRAYENEEVDWNLVQRHEAEIFPLMKKRHLFNGVENFILYDFHTPGGAVDEEVFAYSNRAGHEGALIIYNNKYQTTRGWVRLSTPLAVGDDGSEKRKLVRKSLAEGLNLRSDDAYFCVFRDFKSGLEYIRRVDELKDGGLYVELGAYQYHAFLQFREIQDDREKHYARLESLLAGRGVPNMEEALKEMLLAPVRDPFREIMSPLMLERLVDVRRDGFDAPQSEESVDLLKSLMSDFIYQIKKSTGAPGDPREVIQNVPAFLRAIVHLNCVDTFAEWNQYPNLQSAVSDLGTVDPTERGLRSPFWRISLAWLVVCDLGRIKSDRGYEQQSAAWMDEWLLGRIISQTFQVLGCDEASAQRETDLVKILVSHRQGFGSGQTKDETRSNLKALLTEPEVQQFLEFNWYDGVLWFSKERFEELMEWLFLVSVLDLIAPVDHIGEKVVQAILERHEVVQQVIRWARRSEYRVQKLLTNLTTLTLS
ncbi:MAG: alpha-amylase, partial [Proteobacteria bacterium]|nr:alpha-amylase [Pseudomonadota bacterium]NIS67888.1 alpha-amylase [Pseudomonadota bacterium]